MTSHVIEKDRRLFAGLGNECLNCGEEMYKTDASQEDENLVSKKASVGTMVPWQHHSVLETFENFVLLEMCKSSFCMY